jgi:hypothetical protein
MYEIHSNSQGMPYDHYSRMLAKSNVHCEHMKNFLHQIHFMLDHALYGDTVVYVGAANASHLPKLHELFQHMNFEWHLYDTGSFSSDVLNFAQVHASHVKLYDKDFCMEDAKEHAADQNLLFIYNNNNVRQAALQYDACFPQSHEGTNLWNPLEAEALMADQSSKFYQLQAHFVQTMLPKASSLHVKPLYNPPNKEQESLHFFCGKLYTLPFAGQNSTEMRLIATREDVQKGLCSTYTHTQLEKAAAFFNRRIRPHGFDSKCLQIIAKKYTDTYQMSSSIAGDLKNTLCNFLLISKTQ